MKPNRRAESGQAWLEFILSAAMLTLTLSGAGWVLRAQWIRARCAVLTFERTHARAHERVPSLNGTIAIGFTEPNDTVKGDAQCPPVRETATVARLR